MKTDENTQRSLTDLKPLVRKLRRFVRDLNTQTHLVANPVHNKVFKNLLSYIDLQLTRLLSLIPNGPVDLFALVTRDLIEVVLWSQFITTSDLNMRQFRDESSVDISELFKLLDPGEEKYAELERKVLSMGGRGRKRVDLKKVEPNDNFWFKLCSKFIHPTSWSINLLHKSPHTQYYRLELSSYAFKCAIRALTTLTDLPVPAYLQE